MSIALIVTHGYGNGTFNGTIADVVRKGYTPGEAVVEEVEEVFSGGWWYDYDYEYKRREQERAELQRLEREAGKIQDKLDRELAEASRKRVQEEFRLEELRRLRLLAAKHKEELKQSVSEKALKAAESAFETATYSRLERMEREIAKSREEELFLIQATQIILNQ